MEDMNRPYDIKHHYYMYDIGWLIDKIQEVSNELDQAIDLRTIHYADPINWDITTQYQANTVVVDNKTGVAYISSQNVPAGVLLTNTTYWNPIFNYNDAINKLMSTIAYNEQDSPTATAAHAKNSFIYSNAVLYQAIRDIAEGDALKVGANLQLAVLSDSINIAIEAVRTAAREAVAGETAARTGADDALSNQIAAEVTARENADANYRGANRVSTVTGDDTRTAGDITDTADNIVIHGKRSILIDSDGACTETVALNRELDVNGDDSVHIDGASTLNIGGLRTEVYAADKSDSVNGSHTINRNNITATVTGKTNISAKDVAVSADKISINSTATTLPLTFPDKTIDLHNLDNIGSEKRVIIALGDSLGAGISPEPAPRSEYGWLYQLRDYGNKNKNITVYTNLNVVIAGNSGFASTAPFLTQLKLIVVDNKINMADVTDIVIFGGTNDCDFIDTTLRTALDDFFTYVKENFPNATCLLGTLIAAYHAVGRTSGTLMQIYRSYAEKYGYKYTPDIYNICLRSAYLSSDAVHLTPEGYKAIHLFLLECALTGHTSYAFASANLYPNNIAVYYSISESGIGVTFGTTGDATALYIGNVQVNSIDTKVLSVPTTLNILCNMPNTRVCPVLVSINGNLQMGDYYLKNDNSVYLGLSAQGPTQSGTAFLMSGATQTFISTSAIQY